MQENQPTAREQFARDVMMILTNTQSAHEFIMKKANRLNTSGEALNLNTYRLAEFIRDYVENCIASALDPKARNAQTVGVSLIAEICNGWGIDPYYDMARDYMANATESAGV